VQRAHKNPWHTHTGIQFEHVACHPRMLRFVEIIELVIDQNLRNTVRADVAQNAVNFGNNAKADGPLVASYVVFSNNVTSDNFPTIQTVPAGMPGNPAVYAQPNPPQLYAG